MGKYLGRVNVAGLFPSTLYLLGLFGGFTALARLALNTQMGIKVRYRLEKAFTSLKIRAVPREGFQGGTRDLALALFVMIVIFSFAGYAWFLIRYPNPGKGDTIKAGYVLHVFPFLALMAGDLLERLRKRSNLLYIGVLVLLTLLTIHNLSAMLTHYIPLEKMASLLGVNIPEWFVAPEGWIR